MKEQFIPLVHRLKSQQKITQKLSITKSIPLLLLLFNHLVYAQKAEIEFLPNLPYDKYELKTEKDTLCFYLSVTAHSENLPLIVYVQGSGMNSLFTKDQKGRVRSEYGHMTWFDAGKEKFRILLVEKPGVKYLQTGQSKSFDKKFSLENWCRTLETAIDYVIRHEKVSPDKVLIAGHSEGGIASAGTANRMKNRISHVAVIAGEGPSQLYSLYKFAADGTFFNTPEHNMPSSEERLNYLTDKWKDILKHPNDTDKKFWGFSYLRWSSMLKTSVMEELASFDGKITIVQGTADKAVHPESAVIAYTTLLSKGKDITLNLIENADHSFNLSDKPNADGWKIMIEEVMQWFQPDKK